MDSTDSAIRFDETGQCDHCRTFYTKIKPAWAAEQLDGSALDRLSEKIRKQGKGRDFDCILGMSGGIDSSYLVHLAVERMGLRPLIFHVDAGWNSKIAVNNIEKIIDHLRLDLYTEVINWEEMRDLQLAFFKSGVPHLDTPQDHAFFATMYRFAAQNKVPAILTGGNFSTECVRNPMEWMYFQSDSRQLRNIHARFGARNLNTFPMTSILWHKVWLPYVRGIKIHRPLDMIDYVKDEAKQLLQDRFGWLPYPQKHFESRFTRFYESYWLYERFGFDVRKVQFSSLILTGQMSREDALNELQTLPYNCEEIRNEKAFIANKLEISLEELEIYFTIPKKSWRNYKNQQWIYSFGAFAMRALGLEHGGKR